MALDFGRFSLAQLTVTQIPQFKGLNTPDSVKQANLARLVKEVLEPLYERVGPFTIDSAFRNEAVNKAVGGSAYSFHVEGKAADLVPAMGAKAFAATIQKYPELRALVGELIVNSDRIVHVSLPNPPKVYPISRRIAGEGYVAFNTADLKKFISENAVEIKTGIAGFLLLGVGAYLALKK
jgi:hypothetical protein